MISRLKKFVAAGLALVVAATALPIVTPAEAGGWGKRHHHYSSRRDSGAAVAAGILGLAAGAMIGGSLAQSRTYHAPPPARYRAPRVNYAPAPWTNDWYAYCASKYRSFDPSTGTYITYSGRERLCR